ncbi:hypothetical protein K488DRAFT_42993 [Vararia minispora EC-137]|uniref:Uncharacterized protein n=1 Tax=Vararia minispora EC-137 TaxID=1314806 RepID=A0ACB8QVN0_9AGAM|nr:hypothetical protein K488DRAFT_42993 [Vararia minispora EC-137]
MSYEVPASIRSVYRIFLRACAASVLHHPAKRTLRRLWRGNFDAAVSVHKEYMLADLSAAERAKRAEWLRIWESRVDNTLELLLTSATSRGLPHKLTKNLSRLHWDFINFNNDRYNRQGPAWDPSPDSYKDIDEHLRVLEKRRKGALRGKDLAYDAQAWGALEEVVRMAEGTSGLVLGQPTFRRIRGFR